MIKVLGNTPAALALLCLASVPIDRNSGHYYSKSMTTNALLMREIETMPEETATQVLDFAAYLKSKHPSPKPHNKISIKDAYGIFKDLKGMDTTIERDEEDRI